MNANDMPMPMATDAMQMHPLGAGAWREKVGVGAGASADVNDARCLASEALFLSTRAFGLLACLRSQKQGTWTRPLRRTGKEREVWRDDDRHCMRASCAHESWSDAFGLGDTNGI